MIKEFLTNDLVTNILGGVFATLILIIGAYIVNIYRKKLLKEDEKEVIKSFQNIINQLSSNNEVERISAAILLRKFFDKESTFGKGGRPLEKEVCNIISGLLREESTSHFQKILADTLRYAKSLENMDLQYANLTNAFLGKRGLNFRNSDFYRANLTQVTFKPQYTSQLKIGEGVDLANSVFYETIIDGTNFSYANLTNTNFINIKFKNTIFKKCDLKDVEFNNCEFENVIFENCKHQPQNINIKNFSKKGKIFISHPRIKLPEQDVVFEIIKKHLKQKGFDLILIEKKDEQNDAILRLIDKRIDESDALLALNFKQLEIKQAYYRWWNNEEKTVFNSIFLSTPWVIVETSMAIKKGLSVFVISDVNNSYDIFNQILKEENIFYSSKINKNSLNEIIKNLDKWLYNIIK